MNTFENIWRKLANSKQYRAHYALALLKRSVPFQIKDVYKRQIKPLITGLTAGSERKHIAAVFRKGKRRIFVESSRLLGAASHRRAVCKRVRLVLGGCSPQGLFSGSPVDNTRARGRETGGGEGGKLRRTV